MSRRVVLIYRVDRLARDNFLAEKLWRELTAHCPVVSVSEAFDDSLTGTLMRQILQSFAQYERAVIALRTKTGRRSAVEKQGTYSGGRGCMGYRPVGKRGQGGKGALQVVEAEAEAVRMVFDAKRSGLSLRKIAAKLTAAGYTTFAGCQFDAKAVKRILDREDFYRGSVLTRSSVDAVGGAHVPILNGVHK
jgi:DNA invertase Pin-like site-specific DNA recombinase